MVKLHAIYSLTSYFALCCCEKTLTHYQHGESRVCLVYISLTQPIMGGIQSRNSSRDLETETEEAMEERCLSLLSYATQDYLHMGSTAHSRLDPHSLTKNKSLHFLDNPSLCQVD